MVADTVHGDAEPVYRLTGINASPYSVKMRALMRYRRLPFVWDRSAPQFRGEASDAPLPLIPVLRLPQDGSAHVDSHRLIDLLERRHADRSVSAPSPGVRFVGMLVEDFADEWLSKCMFFYRWASARGTHFATSWVGSEIFGAGQPIALAAEAEHLRTFAARQVARMDMVGSGSGNAAVLEAHYSKILDMMTGLLRERRFLLGDRPSRADFGLYGQLRQLSIDPVSAEIMQRDAPLLPIWLDVLDDASGEEGERWIDDAEIEQAPGLMALLDLIAGSYARFMEQNLKTLAAGGERATVLIEGETFSQPPSRYHAKRWRRLGACFRELREAMPPSLADALAERGCQGAPE